MTKDEYIKLCHEIWQHNKRYYIDCAPTISDYQFDQLMQRLIETEAKHPEWVEKFSPTQRVGELLTEGFVSAPHQTPMLSLPNTYSDPEITEFLKRVEKNLEGEKTDFCVELKMDGTAVSVIYEKGLFQRAVTRGNGVIGDDVSRNIKTISELPLKLHLENPPDYLELRGEVYLELKGFEKLNKERDEDGLPIWANPRNAAAGSLKLLNPKEAAARKLKIVFYAMAQGPFNQVKTQYEVHRYLKDLGLPTLPEIALCKNEKEIWSFRDRVYHLRRELPFEIDGIVIKVNDLNKQSQMGATSKIPRWATAYKFAPEQGITQIEDILVNVGRTGVLTPLALLNHVRVAGSTISRVTLHNQDEIQRKDIRQGDTVIIEKGGDVIPKVVEVVYDKRPFNSVPWKMPAFCPSCQSGVVKLEGEVAYRCFNAACPEKNYRHLTFFVSKEAMDIEHLGVKVMRQLVDKKYIQKASDIYRLTEVQISTLDGFKSKSIHKLLESIEQSKSVDFARFIMALDIRYVGATTADDLAFHSKDIWDLSKKSIEELLSIEGIGEKIAHSIFEYFQDHFHLSEIKAMLEHGVKPQKAQTLIDHPFEGKVFVLTGTLNHYTRDQAAGLIKERGGKISSSVGQKTDYLLLGESPGSKYEKAKKLNVNILTEEQFTKIL